MRKATIAVLTALMMVAATVAVAKEPPTGPPDGKGPQAALMNNDGTWACGAPDDELPFDNHCLNIRSAGETMNIKVFDSQGPQESASADEKADLRPCPHDADATDGTWWYNADAGLYVCHHSGQQPQP